MQRRLWGVLHHTVDHAADSWDVTRQTGGRSLRPIDAGQSLPVVRETGEAPVLRPLTPWRRDVWTER